MVRHRKQKRALHQPGLPVPRPRAFTILELLLVVSIIALLIALLIPGMMHAMRQANSTVCMHNLREVGQALHIYRLENDGWLPNVDVYSRRRVSTWFVKLFPKPLVDYAVLTCPEDPFKSKFRELREDQDESRIANASSYGLNNFLVRAGGGYLLNMDRHNPARPMHTLLAADIGPDHHSTASSRRRGEDRGVPRNASTLQWDDGYDPYYEEAGYPWITTRHGTGINVLTMGNSVVQSKTFNMMRNPIRSYYARCANGGCSLCNDLEDLPHYNFSEDQLYWYTGRLPGTNREARR